MPQFARGESNKRGKNFASDQRDGFALRIFLNRTTQRTKKVHLAFRRDVLREDTPWDGASAVPAGGFVTRSRAASGIILPAQRPACEVLAVRGQSFVFPARVTPMEKRKVSASRLRRPYRIERSGLLLGSMAWCRALGTSCLPGQSRSGTPRGERAPQERARARKARSRHASLGVPLPLLLRPGWAQGKPRNGARGEGVREHGGMKNSRANKNRAVRTGALVFHLSPRAERGRPREARRVRGPHRDSVPSGDAPSPNPLPARGERARKLLPNRPALYTPRLSIRE